MPFTNVHALCVDSNGRTFAHPLAGQTLFVASEAEVVALVAVDPATAQPAGLEPAISLVTTAGLAEWLVEYEEEGHPASLQAEQSTLNVWLVGAGAVASIAIMAGRVDPGDANVDKWGTCVFDPNSVEGAIAMAFSIIEARDREVADLLAALDAQDQVLTERVCAAMEQIQAQGQAISDQIRAGMEPELLGPVGWPEASDVMGAAAFAAAMEEHVDQVCVVHRLIGTAAWQVEVVRVYHDPAMPVPVQEPAHTLNPIPVGHEIAGVWRASAAHGGIMLAVEPHASVDFDTVGDSAFPTEHFGRVCVWMFTDAVLATARLWTVCGAVASSNKHAPALGLFTCAGDYLGLTPPSLAVLAALSDVVHDATERLDALDDVEGLDLFTGRICDAIERHGQFAGGKSASDLTDALGEMVVALRETTDQEM